MRVSNLLLVRLIALAVLAVCLSSISVAQPGDTHFAAGVSALAIPFELNANVIFLQVRVNGSKPLSFILDTGAYSIINTAHARSLGMKLQLVGKTNSIGADPRRSIS